MTAAGVPAAHVRPARASDAPAIARVQLRAWQAGYAHLGRPLLDDLSADDLAEPWRAATVAPPSDRHRVLVADGADGVVGFAAIAPARDPDSDPTVDGELVTLLVDPRAGRQGHGSRLLSAATDYLRDDGFRHALTWLLSTDDVLRRFLGDAGWAADGAYRDLEVGEDAVVRQIRVHTALEERPVENGTQSRDHGEDRGETS
jgi:ribosomal protein S18 acetylase RimI-like enzyme